MPNIRTHQRSFNGGELSPHMFGQITDAKYQSGLSLCRNFIAKPQGPAENRPGTIFVREVKDSAKKTRLINFSYSATQTIVIEMGAGYFRFHTHAGTVMNGPVPYEIANPYAESDLFEINFVQSADVMTLVHKNHAPRELRRLGATNWVLGVIAFSAPISAPPSISLAGNGTSTLTNKYTYTYVVTSISSDGVSESVASAQSSIGFNLSESGTYITIGWAPVTGVSAYNIYKLQGGLFGFIGQTSALSIIDDNISADMSKTPPIYDQVFSGAGEYPGAVSYFEQRRCFAGSVNKPQHIWMTKPGTESDMSYSLPVTDADRIKFRIAAREINEIRHIVSLSELLLLTSSAEWRVASSTDALTQSTLAVRPQAFVGASRAIPVIVNNTVLYCSARGGHIRECAYNWQASGFVTGDMSLRSAHLFDGYDIVDMAYSKAPQPIVWMVSTSGKLLGLTYVPEQQVGAWHQHDTDGVFESCTVVAEDDEDALYVVVRRTIGGVQRRYVECLSSRAYESQEEAFFVDSGLSYYGTPATTITGLSHLEGKTVSILADGAVHPQRTVTAGSITLDRAASIVHVGLQIIADIETLPVAAQVDGGLAQGRKKNVNRVWMRTYSSSGIFAGPDEDSLTEAKIRTSEPYGVPASLQTREIDISIKPKWGDGAQVFIRHSDPLPITIVSLTLEIAIGA